MPNEGGRVVPDMKSGGPRRSRVRPKARFDRRAASQHVSNQSGGSCTQCSPKLLRDGADLADEFLDHTPLG